MSYLCVIPARGGSKGVPGKNLRQLAGKPLINWSIEHALSAKTVCRVLVSTDDVEIAETARSAGAEVPFLRPAELATDEAATEPVLLNALDNLDDPAVTALVLLQPTSPLRFAGALDRAVTLFEEKSADSLVSVSPAPPFLWRLHPEQALYDWAARPRRQDVKPHDRLFAENGSIYITSVEILRRTGNRIGGAVALFVMSVLEGFEIDTPEDLDLVEALLRSR